MVLPVTPRKRASRLRRSCRSCVAISRLRSKESRAPIGTRRNHRIVPDPAAGVIQTDEASFRALLEKITRDRGFRCASYKDKCLRRRIAVRMRAKGAFRTDEYAGMLDTDPREYDRLLRSLTVNVTKFFRNWDTFSAIENKVIPALWERRDGELRVWSAGCASGEEPYSIGILLHKYAMEKKEHARLETVTVVGTDIDGDCLVEAERAFYAEAA